MLHAVANDAESAVLALFTTGKDNPLLRELHRHLARASQMGIAVAFVMPSGVGRLLEHLEGWCRAHPVTFRNNCMV